MYAGKQTCGVALFDGGRLRIPFQCQGSNNVGTAANNELSCARGSCTGTWRSIWHINGLGLISPHLGGARWMCRMGFLEADPGWQELDLWETVVLGKYLAVAYRS